MHTAQPNQVTFTARTLFTGALVAYAIAAAGAGVWYTVTYSAAYPWTVFAIFFQAALFGLPLALFGSLIAYALGMLLRPQPRQSLHVAAFFAVFAAITFAVTLASGVAPAHALWLGLAAGTAAAIGRASVWHLVTTQRPTPQRTEHSRPEAR